MAETSNITDLMTIYKMQQLAGGAKNPALEAATTAKTSGEEFSGGLVTATQDIPQNTFGGGLAKGLAQGYDLMEKKKGGTKREQAMERLLAAQAAAQEQDQKMNEWMQGFAQKKALMAEAEQEAMMSGEALANSLQALELGDNGAMQSYLAANPKVATLLGDDGEGGIGIDGVRVVNRGDAKMVQAYGRDSNGKPWAGQEMSLDGILKTYAPTVYEARSKATLEAAKTQADINKTNADANKAQAMADSKMVYQMITDAEGNTVQVPQPAAAPAKPLPASSLKLLNEAKVQAQSLTGLNTDIDALGKMIDSGHLELGPVKNLVNRGQNYFGVSDEESRNLASFDTALEQMRNAILLQHRGVQTEGDANRAMNQLISNKNDPDLVRQRLQEIKVLNERAAGLKKMEADTILQNYGQAPMQDAAPTNAAYGQQAPQAAPQTPQGQPVAQLPQGAQQVGTSGGKPVYKTPDGKMFVGQ